MLLFRVDPPETPPEPSFIFKTQPHLPTLSRIHLEDTCFFIPISSNSSSSPPPPSHLVVYLNKSYVDRGFAHGHIYQSKSGSRVLRRTYLDKKSHAFIDSEWLSYVGQMLLFASWRGELLKLAAMMRISIAAMKLDCFKIIILALWRGELLKLAAMMRICLDKAEIICVLARQPFIVAAMANASFLFNYSTSTTVFVSMNKTYGSKLLRLSPYASSLPLTLSLPLYMACDDSEVCVTKMIGSKLGSVRSNNGSNSNNNNNNNNNNTKGLITVLDDHQLNGEVEVPIVVTTNTTADTQKESTPPPEEGSVHQIWHRFKCQEAFDTFSSVAATEHVGSRHAENQESCQAFGESAKYVFDLTHAFVNGQHS
ncbi:hypothetical protein Tco_0991657 [Tanacetum coccineum]|uniref:C2H2-type domain-containing protein n=1 Tax=Tanacetum coccineum TaxID=301880 RepID=A0ABQ5F0M4_9ASTR